MLNLSVYIEKQLNEETELLTFRFIKISLCLKKRDEQIVKMITYSKLCIKIKTCKSRHFHFQKYGVVG